MGPRGWGGGRCRRATTAHSNFHLARTRWLPGRLTCSTAPHITGPSAIRPLGGAQQHHALRSLTSTAFHAFHAFHSRGASPTYGELGYGEGESKSSTTEKKVEYLDSADVIQVCAAAVLGGSSCCLRAMMASVTWQSSGGLQLWHSSMALSAVLAIRLT